jgi:hypothetical protein
MRTLRSAVAGVVMCSALQGAVHAAATTPAQAATEHERIARERAEVEATYTKQEATCQEGFVVTPCLEAARKAQRDGLARLRRQEVLLDEEQRKARAAQRMQAIRSNLESQGTRPTAPTPPGAAAEARAASKAERTPNPPSTAMEERRANVAERAHEAQVRRGQESANVERYEERQREAEAHRREVEQRNAKRDASGKKSAPLPVPGASAP